MNICLVSRELYPYQKAGIAVYVSNLRNMLVKNGHRVYIVTSKENTDKMKYSEDISYIGVDPYEYGENFRDFSLAYSYSVYRTLKKLSENVTLDIIEFSDYGGEGYFSILFNRVENIFSESALVMKLHTPTYECNIANEIENECIDIICQEDYAIKHIDNLYAISKTMSNSISNRLSRDDIEVIYNPINLIESNKESDYEVLSDDFFLFVGRIEKRKGVDYFIDAAIKLIDNGARYSFVIIGNDTHTADGKKSFKNYLVERIPANYSNRFVWMNSVSQSELMKYYSKAVCSVFPSRYEGFGNVCVEAMLCGSPVIVSSNTGMEEIVNYGEYGLVFENGNVGDLFDKMTDIINDLSLKSNFGLKSKIRSSDFSLENLYEKQIDYYSNCRKKSDEYMLDFEEKNMVYYVNKSITSANEIRNMHDQITLLSKQLQENKDISDSYLNECKLVTSESNRLMSEIIEVNRINSELTKDFQRCSDENSRLIIEWEKMKDLLTQFKSDYEKLQDKTTFIEEKNYTLNNYCNEINEESNTLRNNISILEEKSNSLQNELNVMKKQLCSKKFLLKRLLGIKS